jgi:hypothetical protein
MKHNTRFLRLSFYGCTQTFGVMVKARQPATNLTLMAVTTNEHGFVFPFLPARVDWNVKRPEQGWRHRAKCRNN